MFFSVSASAYVIHLIKWKEIQALHGANQANWIHLLLSFKSIHISSSIGPSKKTTIQERMNNTEAIWCKFGCNSCLVDIMILTK